MNDAIPPPPLPAGRGRWTNLKPAGIMSFFTALSLSSLPNRVSVTATRSKLFATIWSLIMAALFLRERLLIRQVEANLRRPSADMLWRGIEINVREGLSLFKLDWIWWSVPFSWQFGAQSIVEFTDVTRLLGLQIEWRNNVFLTGQSDKRYLSHHSLKLAWKLPT